MSNGQRNHQSGEAARSTDPTSDVVPISGTPSSGAPDAASDSTCPVARRGKARRAKAGAFPGNPVETAESVVLSRRGARSRRKGAEGERALVLAFAEVFGRERVRRGLQFRDGSEVPDVIAPNLWVESKRGRKPNPRAALAQALEASAGKSLWPVCVVRDDHAEPFVVMTLPDFLDLLKEWWSGRKA